MFNVGVRNQTAVVTRRKVAGISVCVLDWDVDMSLACKALLDSVQKFVVTYYAAGYGDDMTEDDLLESFPEFQDVTIEMQEDGSFLVMLLELA